MRSVAIDELLGVLKLRLPSNPQTKLIVTSATLDVGKMTDFFDGAPSVGVSGRTYPVERINRNLERYEHHSEAAVATAIEVLESFAREDKLHGVIHPQMFNHKAANLTQEQIDQSFKMPPSSAVMVVLPGKEDIRLATDRIANAAERLGIKDKVEILEVHGESSTEIQLKVQRDPVPQGMIRFVVGTEVIARSITAQGAVVVIDSGERKRNVITSVGIPRLEKQDASQAELEQAAGRAGRTQPGIGITIRDMHGSQPPLFPTPEIMTAPLETTILRIASMGEKVETFPFLDPPPAQALKLARQRLIRLGAIEEDGSITTFGEKLRSIPLTPGLAVSVLSADKTGTVNETILATAAIAAERVFNRPFKDAVLTIPASLARSILESRKAAASSRGFPNSAEEEDKLPYWLQERADGKYSLVVDDMPGGRDPYARLTRLYFANMNKSGSQDDDFSAAVNAIRTFHAERSRIEGEMARKQKTSPNGKLSYRDVRESANRELTEWCNAHCLDRRKVEEVIASIPEIVEAVNRAGIAVGNPLRANYNYDSAALVRSLVPAQLDHLAVKEGGNGYSSQIGPVSISYSSLAQKESPIILTSRPNNVPTGTGFRLIADVVAPIGVDDLAHSMPHLLSERRSNDARYQPGGDDVLQTRELYFLGLRVHSERTSDLPPAEKSAALLNWLSSNPSATEASFAAPVRNLLNYNQRGLTRAAELNARAGQELFPANDQALRKEILQRGLAGQSSLGQVVASRTLNALRLPELDRTTAKQVILDNPIYLTVDGVRRKVSYNWKGPTLTLNDKEMEAEGAWQRLPDKVLLPGGREVSFTGSALVGNYYKSVGPMPAPEFKKAVAAMHAETMYLRYKKEHGISDYSRMLPQPVNLKTISEIVPLNYGDDLGSGKTLTAYQAVAYSYGTYYHNVFPTRSDAENSRDYAVTTFQEQETRKQVEDMRLQLAQLIAQTASSSNQITDIRQLNDRLRYGVNPEDLPALKSQFNEIERNVKENLARMEAENQRANSQARALYEYQQAVFRLGNLEEISALLVRPNGNISVFCGHDRTADAQQTEVSPAFGARISGPALIPGTSNGLWQDIPTNRKVTIYQSANNQQIQFTVPKAAIAKDLPPGVYSLAKAAGQDGLIAFPRNYWEGVANQTAVIPLPNQVTAKSLHELEARPQQAIGTELFTEKSERNFQCNTCDGTTRLTKSAYRDYKAGKTTNIECPHCDTHGVLNRQPSGTAVPAESAPNQSAMEKRLQDLANKFK